MRTAFVETLTRLAAGDDRIFLVTGDLGFGVLTDYAKRFPRQYVNAGVAEQNMTGLACGMALEGHVVFTYSIANFPTLRCLEQLRNDACYHGANVKVVAVGGGFSYGPLGISHHATEDIAILRALPGVSVVVPSSRWEAAGATEGVASTPGVCYLRLDKSFGPDAASPGESFQLGRARRIREGKDLTIVVAGGILGEAMTAAATLSGEGVECRVLSMHTVKPLDVEALAVAVQETGGLLTLEEHTLCGGLGGAVAEACMDEGLSPRRFGRMGLHSEFSSIVGSQEYLRVRYGLDAAAIAERVRSLLKENGKEKL